MVLYFMVSEIALKSIQTATDFRINEDDLSLYRKIELFSLKVIFLILKSNFFHEHA